MEVRDHGYRYIVAWGLMMGSEPGYVEGECAAARLDNAPKDALYRSFDGTWFTFDDIPLRNSGVRMEVNKQLRRQYSPQSWSPAPACGLAD